ncbi:MAG: hypothetical protein WCK18_15930 [Prolixibacteraceae bacterium]
MSISRDQLIQFVEKQGLLKEQTIGDLKEIVDEFPYFQSAQLLYTYNLFSRANFRYEAYLKTCSIYAADRTILYQLLKQPDRPSMIAEPVKPVDKRTTEIQELFELNEDPLIPEMEINKLSVFSASDTEIIDLDLLSFEPVGSSFSMDEYPIKSEPEISASETNEDLKIDLIDQFIKVNPSIQPGIANIPERNEKSESKDEGQFENDEYITETLSRIYLKQGHYQKAIDSFERLSLKFPEKSVYFAQQIEEIKKLLN